MPPDPSQRIQTSSAMRVLGVSIHLDAGSGTPPLGGILVLRALRTTRRPFGDEQDSVLGEQLQPVASAAARVPLAACCRKIAVLNRHLWCKLEGVSPAGVECRHVRSQVQARQEESACRRTPYAPGRACTPPHERSRATKMSVTTPAQITLCLVAHAQGHDQPHALELSVQSPSNVRGHCQMLH